MDAEVATSPSSRDLARSSVTVGSPGYVTIPGSTGTLMSMISMALL
jgi:hypothetical protein